MNAEWEPMLGYCMNKDGSYENPVRINSQQAMHDFLLENVEKFYELRVTDLGDMTTMQVVEQSLIFPLPEYGNKNNKWDSKLKHFVTR